MPKEEEINMRKLPKREQIVITGDFSVAYNNFVSVGEDSMIRDLSYFIDPSKNEAAWKRAETTDVILRNISEIWKK